MLGALPLRTRELLLDGREEEEDDDDVEADEEPVPPTVAATSEGVLEEEEEEEAEEEAFGPVEGLPSPACLLDMIPLISENMSMRFSIASASPLL